MKNSKYIYIWDYKNSEYPFQIFIGGRGTGKSFGALDGAINGEIEDRFIFMRRTAQELDLLMDTDKGEGANPFKSVNRETGRNVGIKRIVKNLGGIFDRETNEETGKVIHSGAPIGYAVALSTIASIRGIDLSDCSDWIYDEFIPEKHVKKMKEEGTALLNAYESVNRNREIEGKPPINMWLLANSNDIYNPIFIELGIVSVVEKMVRTGKSDKYIKSRGLAIHLVNNNTEFVEQKKETALYKLTKGSQFYDMALNNDFAYNDFSLIGHRQLKGYTPICSVDDATIYRKKGDRELYVSYATAKCPHFSAKTEQDRRLFLAHYSTILTHRFMESDIVFESFELKQRLLDIIL